MAVSTRSLLPLSAFLLLLTAGAADARPCKTIFISYTVSTVGPSFPFSSSRLRHPSESLVFLQLNDPEPFPAFSLPYIPASDSDIVIPELPRSTLVHPRHMFDEKPQPFPLPDFLVSGSLRDRTMDILYVVVALLLGVGCGLLTSAAVYLIWSFVYYGRDGEESDDDDEEDEVVGAAGYVKFPADPVKKGFSFVKA